MPAMLATPEFPSPIGASPTDAVSLLWRERKLNPVISASGYPIERPLPIGAVPSVH